MNWSPLMFQILAPLTRSASTKIVFKQNKCLKQHRLPKPYKLCTLITKTSRQEKYLIQESLPHHYMTRSSKKLTHQLL